jgi:hypothetical protein
MNRNRGNYYVSVDGGWEVWFWTGMSWLRHGTDREEGGGVHVFGSVPEPTMLTGETR